MTPQATFCRSCGRQLSDEEKAIAGNSTCFQCAPVSEAQPNVAPPPPPMPQPRPYSAPLDSSISPGLAFVLGLIPGVGAIYNGQYVKGLLHVVVFGILLSIANSDLEGARQMETIAVMLAVVWVPYMAFEAYHTAKKRMSGEAVDEFSSLVPNHVNGAFPTGPVVMIALGVMFLLSNLRILNFSDIWKFWPVLLIGSGVYHLWLRVNGHETEGRNDNK